MHGWRARFASPVATALATALALAVQLACASHALAGEPSQEPHEPARAAAPLPSKDIRWSATLGGAVDAGSLPRASPGLTLGFDVRRGALAARVVGSAFLPEVDHASGASVALFDAMAMICALAPIGSRFDLGACGGGGVGLLRAEAPPSARPDSALAFRPQGVATTRLDVALHPVLYLSLELGTVLDPLRSRLPVTAAGGAGDAGDAGGAGDAGDAHRSSLFSFRAALALHVRLW